MKLPNDVTRCTNIICSQKEQCRRFLRTDDDVKRVYIQRFEPNKDGDCDYKIEYPKQEQQ